MKEAVAYMKGLNKQKRSYKEIKARVERLKKAEKMLEVMNPPLETFGAEVDSIKAKLKSLSQVEQVEQELATLRIKMGRDRDIDVFICYSSLDKAVADTVCDTLEKRGIRCWIADRDVNPGDTWADSIIKAIESARIMVVVLSNHANKSKQILREVTRADDEGIIIVPFIIEEVTLSKSLSYYLATCHWLNAFKLPLEKHLDELADTIKAILTDGADILNTPNENDF